ncbi:MAG: hypothetical protein C7B47_16740 [Sulfobacillus thermosulfidooxidans]|uniref:Bacteriophage holin of superfamily 6 (Holin_LLH) n=1 Tax=Sulfobacillus thermosulfidooxidans TaxID=28034 RepID=A0A2T2WJE5_SULTH|nr:MAG: hypothetical protein C7B47_16740 [Sulfobacillus thermosulfidooxidans]
MHISPQIVSHTIPELAALAGIIVAFLVVVKRPRLVTFLDAKLGKAQASRVVSDITAADHFFQVVLPGIIQQSTGKTEDQLAQKIGNGLIQAAHDHGLNLTPHTLQAAVAAGLNAYHNNAALSTAQVEANATAHAVANVKNITQVPPQADTTKK